MLRLIPALRSTAPTPALRLPLPIRLLTTATPASTAEPRPSIPPSLSSTSSHTLSSQQPKQKSPKVRGPYHVSRTFSNNLAVYHERKRGGNLKLTVIRKVEGDAKTLSQEISTALVIPQDEISVNPVTNHVIIKGHHQDRVKSWLAERGF